MKQFIPFLRARVEPRVDIPVLMYHIVDHAIDSEISVEPSLFKEHIDALFSAGYSTVSLQEYLDSLSSQTSQKGKVLITFDDGYECFYKYAWPILSKHEYTAVQFVLTGWIGRHNWWNPRARYLVKHLSWSQIAELSEDGCDMGAHTTNHQSLVKLSRSQISDNMLLSKLALEQHINKSVTAFSYPYGDYDTRSREIASTMFQVAFSVDQGTLDPGEDRFTINRFNINNRVSAKDLVFTVKATSK